MSDRSGPLVTAVNGTLMARDGRWEGLTMDDGAGEEPLAEGFRTAAVTRIGSSDRGRLDQFKLDQCP